MRAAARERAFDVVVVYCYDRLARDQVHQAVIIDDLEHHYVKIESVTENFDDSALGQFMRNTYAFAAQLEHEKILERTERGRLERAQQGKLVGGGIPLYGYCWKKDHSKYEIDPEEAQEKEENFKQWCAQEQAKLDDPNHEADYEWKREACEKFGVKVLVWRPGSYTKRYEIINPPEIVSVATRI